MKFVSHLIPAVKKTLEEAHQFHPSNRVRQRAHAVLLSDKSYTLSQLSDIFEVNRATASQWIDDWESDGLVGLQDKPKSGRPRSLTEPEIERFRGYVDENPHQLKQAIVRLEGETGKALSIDTYKRALQKNFVPLEAIEAFQQRET
ncbi:MAG: helix-turn-helix domain-containing protein [Thiolinea sp.]